jgi:Raf kinase inhibitor-like YbhB/YbcL family protein
MQWNLGKSAATLAIFLVAGAAGAAAQRRAAPPPSKFKLTSPAYREGSQIPAQYTCSNSKFISPPLDWSNPPANTASFAIILHDSDAAPGKNSMDVTHWILWNVPGTARKLQADIKPNTSPEGIDQGKNIRGVDGFQGPCPPPGATPHHYIFEIYALDQKLDLAAGSSREELLQAMNGHVIGKATYVGRYGR